MYFGISCKYSLDKYTYSLDKYTTHNPIISFKVLSVQQNPPKNINKNPKSCLPTSTATEFHEAMTTISSSPDLLTTPQMAHPQPLHAASEPEPDDSSSLSTQNPSPGPNPNPTQIPTLLHLSFNQDHGCFSVATDVGFRVYNCDPVREIFRREFGPRGGLGMVQMLFRCNVLALVGGGPDPLYSPNKVMIWEDNESRCMCELSFRSEVKGVRLRRDRIVVVLVQKVFVYNFTDLKLLHQIETIANPKGLCEVSNVSGHPVLVCPGLQKGQVRIENYGSKRTKFVMAHDSRLACLALTQDGRLLATASSKGTLIRIFNTLDGSLLQEVRRGADRAEIYSLAFSSTAQWLAVSSDKGTVHVFSLKVDSGSLGNNRSCSASEISPPNPSGISSLSFMKGVLPRYFSSEWSVAKYHLQEGLQYTVAFGHQKNTVVILGMDGSFYRCQFDPVNGGDMTQLEYYNFLKPDETF